MTSKQESRLSMYQAAVFYMLKNVSITEPLPDFATLFLLLQQNIATILKLLKEQNSNLNGNADTKNAQRADIEQRTLNLSGKLVAYATSKNDQDLIQLVKYTKSDLESCTGNQLLSIAANLCDTAEAHLASLSPYRITQEEIAGLRTVCNMFLEKLPQPKESIRDMAQLTLALDELFKATDKLLLKLDAIMLIVRQSDPEFYNHYLNSRKVIYIGTRHLAIRGRVIHAVTGNGLKGVTLILELAGGTPAMANALTGTDKITKKTAAKGGFMHKMLETGTYIITVTKEGFAPQVITVYVTYGEPLIVNIALQPL